MTKVLLAISFLMFVAIQSAQAKNKLYTANSLLVPKIQPAAPLAAKKLIYYGGPVIEKVHAVPVYWSNAVNSQIQNAMDDFYSSYVNSKHMDWLSEYNTNLSAVDGRTGTNQKISRGTSTTPILIQPALTSKQITDEQIRIELASQIDAGTLPRPDSNTIYMIHFPSDISISIEGMSSCFSFGGYHNGEKNQKYGDLFYAVLPDCGFMKNSQGSLSSATFVASHELIEAVTDAYPTPGSSPAYPQAWNDTGGSEIADLCQSGESTLNGAKANYTISLEWSNSRGTCYDGK